ncbi:MAG: penicillin-binding protein 1A [Steroidobacteraceae bacterium]
MRSKGWKLLALAAASVTLIALLGVLGLSLSYVYLEPSLPSIEAMRNVELAVPLRVYTAGGDLIAEIGEQHRIPVPYEQIPLIVRRAFLAAEDDRFFQHHGFDYLGVLRAIAVDISTGQRTEGASTITMQAARNMFLTLDKTWRRKLEEAFLTYRMEHAFTKQHIFGMYLNKIFFGERAYGIAAAAQTYFGESLDELSLAQAATLAGLPQAPSRYNPIINPKFARARRRYVLRRMRDLGFITAAAAQAANATPIDAVDHGPVHDVEGQYVAEMVREEMLSRFGPRAETAGYQVYTTLDGRMQAAANRAVRLGLIEYDRRYGYRGPVGHVDLSAGTDSERLEALLDPYPSVGMLSPAVVVSVGSQSAAVFVKAIGVQKIGWDGLAWARKYRDGGSPGPEPKSAGEVVAPGDVVYVATDGRNDAQLAQVPQAQAALVALDPDDGAIAALVGGFDYFANKFNRAVQARRQPGSGFKPFLYSAALDDGFTPASILLDAPIVMDNVGTEGVWRPENSDRNFMGPIRMRVALEWSRNLASIRLLQQIGIPYATTYATRFGFTREQLPQNLTLALGTLQASPLQMASAYAVFANGGFRVDPYFIGRIVGPDGTVLYQAKPRLACPLCEQPASLASLFAPAAGSSTAGSAGPVTGSALLAAADAIRGGRGALPENRLAPRVISPQNDFLMTSLLADVIRHGTGQRALALNRTDIAGKTGTTNEARDAWFNGFTPNLVATVWVGYDDERPLGETEEGAHTALPIWVYFMREALQGVPETSRPMPDGLVTLRISPTTGRLASAENPNAILETFMVNHLPAGGGPAAGSQGGNEAQAATGNSLF